MQNRIVVGLSVGAMAFIAGIVGLAVLAVCATNLVQGVDGVEGRPPQYAPAPRILPRVGDLKESEIEAVYGKVNKSALSEVKEGIFSRIRARRAARMACPPCNNRSVSYSRSVVVHRGPVVVPYQPRPVVEPYPQIDPATCVDGSCALRQPAATAVAEEAHPELDLSTCKDGSCALKRSAVMEIFSFGN